MLPSPPRAARTRSPAEVARKLGAVASISRQLRDMAENLAAAGICPRKGLQWAKLASEIMYEALDASRMAAHTPQQPTQPDAPWTRPLKVPRRQSPPPTVVAAPAGAAPAKAAEVLHEGDKGAPPPGSVAQPFPVPDAVYMALAGECDRLKVPLAVGMDVVQAIAHVYHFERMAFPTKTAAANAAILAGYLLRRPENPSTADGIFGDVACMPQYDLADLLKTARAWISAQPPQDKATRDSSPDGSASDVSMASTDARPSARAAAAPASRCSSHASSGKSSRATSPYRDALLSGQTRSADEQPRSCDNCRGRRQRVQATGPVLRCHANGCHAAMHQQCGAVKGPAGRWFCIKHGFEALLSTPAGV
jgi:hypothetical protein